MTKSEQKKYGPVPFAFARYRRLGGNGSTTTTTTSVSKTHRSPARVSAIRARRERRAKSKSGREEYAPNFYLRFAQTWEKRYPSLVNNGLTRLCSIALIRRERFLECGSHFDDRFQARNSESLQTKTTRRRETCCYRYGVYKLELLLYSK